MICIVKLPKSSNYQNYSFVKFPPLYFFYLASNWNIFPLHSILYAMNYAAKKNTVYKATGAVELTRLEIGIRHLTRCCLCRKCRTICWKIFLAKADVRGSGALLEQSIRLRWEPIQCAWLQHLALLKVSGTELSKVIPAGKNQCLK